jgi:hypothetical protein
MNRWHTAHVYLFITACGSLIIMVILYGRMLMIPDPHAAAVAAALEIKNIIAAAQIGDPTDQTWPDLAAEDANSTAATQPDGSSLQQRLHLLHSKAQYSTNRRFLYEPLKTHHVTNCRDAMERLLSSQDGSSAPQTLVCRSSVPSLR